MEDLSADELEIFQELFKIIDIDQEGAITYKDLGLFLRSFAANVTEAVLQDMISEADMNGNGTIAFPEFVGVLLRKLSDTGRPDDLKMVFSIFDKEKNGYISTSDIIQFYAVIGLHPSEEEIDGILRDADTQCEGNLSYDDFFDMMTSMIPKI